MRVMTSVEKLSEICDRWEMAPPRVKRHLGVLVAGAIPDAEAAFDAVGDRISAKNDWLDTHRWTQHPKWHERWERMYFDDTREHATIGEAIARARRMLTTGIEVAA